MVQQLEQSQPPRTIVQRALEKSTSILLIGLVLILIAGCGRSTPDPAQAADMETTIGYTELPDGLGRGYPLLSFAGVDTGAEGLVPGQPAPNFRMVLDDGNSLTLADLRGNPVLINFWATWCGPCRLEMPDIVRHYNEDEDLIVLAVNVQEQMDAIAPFADDFQMNMPIVRDLDGELRRIYDLRGMPTSIFINREGNVTAVWPGVLTPRQIEELLADIL